MFHYAITKHDATLLEPTVTQPAMVTQDATHITAPCITACTHQVQRLRKQPVTKHAIDNPDATQLEATCHSACKFHLMQRHLAATQCGELCQTSDASVHRPAVWRINPVVNVHCGGQRRVIDEALLSSGPVTTILVGPGVTHVVLALGVLRAADAATSVVTT